MSNENQKKDTRSAAQRLADLEAATGDLFSFADRVTRDLLMLRDGLKLLDNKVNAIVKLASKGEFITQEAVGQTMIENNVEDLASKVTAMVERGILAPETEVSENSFIVGQESDNDGKVVNPRLQFSLKAVAAPIQEKLKGAKVGATLNLEEGKLLFTVLESYKIQEPTQEAPAAAPETAPEAAAPAATEEAASEQTGEAATA